MEVVHQEDAEVEASCRPNNFVHQKKINPTIGNTCK
jgi:hypothetical protein